MPMSSRCLVVTDLDGTLLDSASRLSHANRRALEALGRSGVVRAVATGRSLYSARNVMGDDFPVDYLAFSSGVCIVSWPDGRHLASHVMEPHVVSGLVRRLQDLALDFMVHHAAPASHRFHFVRSSNDNADFEKRIERYRQFARPWREGIPEDVGVSQFVIVEPPGVVSCLDLAGSRIRRCARGAHDITPRPRIDLDRAVSARSFEGPCVGMAQGAARNRPRPHHRDRQRLQRSRHARVGGARACGVERAHRR